MEHLIIDRNVRDALVQYLQLRPWQEVHEIMPVLMGLRSAPPVTNAQTIDPPTVRHE